VEDLLKYINSISPISRASWNALEKILVVRNYKAGTHLSKLNETPSRAYFLSKGYVRGYALSRKGNQYNRALFQPNEFMASLTALLQKSKANLALESLTDCDTYECSFNDFLKLANTHADIKTFYLKILESNFIKFEERNILLATMNATERYVYIRKQIPNIDNIFSQVHIASHLGITPVQLSRIRKKLFSQK